MVPFPTLWKMRAPVEMLLAHTPFLKCPQHLAAQPPWNQTLWQSWVVSWGPCRPLNPPHDVDDAEWQLQSEPRVPAARQDSCQLVLC